jgi:HSP20 family protein
MWPPATATTPRLGRLFDEVFGGEPAEGMGWSPAVDIVEHDGELRLTAEMPGIRREDVQIEVNEGMLTIRGEKKEEKETKNGNARLVERSYGSFERSFTLPRSVAADRIEAEFTDGVLMVHMPKTEKAVGRRIEIAAK